jgi:hypothetical protein
VNQDERDALAEEQGYHVCPHSHETYTACDGDCKHCAIAIGFEKEMNHKETMGDLKTKKDEAALVVMNIREHEQELQKLHLITDDTSMETTLEQAEKIAREIGNEN